MPIVGQKLFQTPGILQLKNMLKKKSVQPLGANILGEAIFWSTRIHLQLQVVLTASEEEHCVLQKNK